MKREEATEQCYVGWVVRYVAWLQEAGANVRDVQEAMGNAHLETTAGYLTPRACAVPSPLETVDG